MLFDPTLRRPVSQLCTAAQFRESVCTAWRKRLKLGERHHRKAWELVYIAQVLTLRGMLTTGRTGVGFGVGREPLPAAFAAAGCCILATDQDPTAATAQGWIATAQHAATLEQLRRPDLCANDVFDRQVTFQHADMGKIAGLGRRFDFAWSACALEHIGSPEAGLQFICDTVGLLKTGGVSVHTTEFLTDERETVTLPGTVLYSERDVRALARRLRRMGCMVRLNLRRGREQLDRFIDAPPYTGNPHLRLRIGEHVTTSVGIVAIKH